MNPMKIMKWKNIFLKTKNKNPKLKKHIINNKIKLNKNKSSNNNNNKKQ